jgi:hypothetical protein
MARPLPDIIKATRFWDEKVRVTYAIRSILHGQYDCRLEEFLVDKAEEVRYAAKKRLEALEKGQLDVYEL